MNRDLTNLRENYQRASLDIEHVEKDPIVQFGKWIDEAISDKNILEPNAMTLCTVDEQGSPDGRIVLLKGFGPNGFIFYTNYESAKGKQLANKPSCSLVFLWKEHERQVRIKGSVKKVSREDTQEYFATRPIKSQVGAWASPQSSVIEGKDVLMEKFDGLLEKYSTLKTITAPPHWGGYIVEPREIEFWQGQRSRLHDRIKFIFVEGKWQIVRLAP